MTSTLQVVTVLAIIATTVAGPSPFTAHVVSPKKCQKGLGCPKGQVCTKQEIVCITTPCDPLFTCVAKGDENRPNPCAATSCETGYSCVAGKSKGPHNKELPIAVCVSPCLKKKCGHKETCVMKPVYEGYAEPQCIPLSPKCPKPQITCDNVRCPEACKMVGCEPICVPAFLFPYAA